MKLTDLDPHWLTFEGRRVGFIFRSPVKREWWQTCFVERFNVFKNGRDSGWKHPDTQCAIIDSSCPQAFGQWQACNPNCQWTVAGGIVNASFETISVTPSLDGSAGGLWHGFITNGQIVGGV